MCEIVDWVVEFISWYVIDILVDLVVECGVYLMFEGLGWLCGMVFVDILVVFECDCGIFVDVDWMMWMDWDVLCVKVCIGMCNVILMVIVLMVLIGFIVGIMFGLDL